MPIARHNPFVFVSPETQLRGESGSYFVRDAVGRVTTPHGNAPWGAADALTTPRVIQRYLGEAPPAPNNPLSTRSPSALPDGEYQLNNEDGSEAFRLRVAQGAATLILGSHAIALPPLPGVPPSRFGGLMSAQTSIVFPNVISLMMQKGAFNPHGDLTSQHMMLRISLRTEETYPHPSMREHHFHVNWDPIPIP